MARAARRADPPMYYGCWPWMAPAVLWA